MTGSTTLSNTMCDILKVMGKDADFLSNTTDTYIEDANNEHKQHLADTWTKTIADRLSHLNMLRDRVRI